MRNVTGLLSSQGALSNRTPRLGGGGGQKWGMPVNSLTDPRLQQGGSRAGFMNPSPVPSQMQAGMGAPMMGTGRWFPGQNALPPMTTGPTPTALPGPQANLAPNLPGGGGGGMVNPGLMPMWNGAMAGGNLASQVPTSLGGTLPSVATPMMPSAPGLGGFGGVMAGGNVPQQEYAPFIQQYMARLQAMGPQRGAQDQMSGMRYLPQNMGNNFRMMGRGGFG